MKRYTKSATILLAALAFAGCSKVEELNNNPDSALQIESVGGVSQYALMQSKAVIDGNTLPGSEAAQGIGIFVTAQDGSAYDGHDKGYSNVKYTYNGEKWNTATPIYLSNTVGKLYGYFPYNAGATNLKAVPVASSLNGTDYLYAEQQEVSISKKSVSLQMNHALARLHLTLKKGEKYKAAGNISKITLKSTAIDATGTMDITTGKVSATKAKTDKGVVELAASGSLSTGDQTYDILLVSADASDAANPFDIIISIDGATAGVTLSGDNGITVQSGKQCDVTLEIQDSGINVSGVGVGVWGDGGSREVQVGEHTVTVKLDEGVHEIYKDVWVMAYEQDGDVIIKSFSNSGKTITCQLDDDTMVASTPDGNLSVFTLPSVSKDIVATIGVWGEGGRKEVTVGEHKVKVVYEEVEDIDKDVFITAYKDGSSAIIKTYSVKTGRFTQCTCTPAGKATCTPSIDAATGICTFTISDVQDDITAEVGYLKCNATIEYDSDMGSVKLEGVAVASGSPVQILYGEEAEFTAEANTGYGFVKWTDGSDKDLSTDNPYTISSVTSDITLKAIFGGLVEISAEVKPAGAGTVMGAGIYAKGSTATLTAIAGEGFAFTGWAKAESPGTIISTNNPYEFAVSQSASYVAVFKLKDALSGVFTVAADEHGNPTKKVQFSKGNLWYGKVGDASEATFNFEANQYDTTPSSDGSRDPNYISHFMWCADATNAMALKYEDGWNEDETFFAGKNFTVNGYSGWSVLTGGSNGEWKFLIDRKDSEGNALCKYGVKVCGKTNCLVLLPDDWKWGENGVGDKWQDGGYPETSTDKVTWQTMETAGAVCLPAAGYRNGYGGNANVNNVGYNGYYWSASPSDDVDAYDLFFNSGGVDPSSNNARGRAQSVRLVTEVK